MSKCELTYSDIEEVALKLYSYCRGRNWAGFDPYDGLNSKVFRSLKFLHSGLPRLVLIQLMKKSPINIRGILRVPASQNPKAIALFLSSSVNLARRNLLPDIGIIDELAATLIARTSIYRDLHGWGYNFDWQALTGFVPAGTPNIICTSFAGHALLDAYDYCPESQWLEMAGSAALLIQRDFSSKKNDTELFLNYMPVAFDLKQIIPIHNASLLGASLLSRVARMTGNRDMLKLAIQATEYSLDKQHDDGAWDYGEWDNPSQRWIDNFHTGFNLCAIHRICRDAGKSEYREHLERGLEYYLGRFFNCDGAPKYYHDKLYPIDIHSSAQSIITLMTLKDLNKDSMALAIRVLHWTISNMYNPEGYFYYQKHRWGVNRISYMRWSQAWMLVALSTVLSEDILDVER